MADGLAAFAGGAFTAAPGIAQVEVKKQERQAKIKKEEEALQRLLKEMKDNKNFMRDLYSGLKSDVTYGSPEYAAKIPEPPGRNKYEDREDYAEKVVKFKKDTDVAVKRGAGRKSLRELTAGFKGGTREELTKNIVGAEGISGVVPKEEISLAQQTIKKTPSEVKYTGGRGRATPEDPVSKTIRQIDTRIARLEREANNQRDAGKDEGEAKLRIRIEALQEVRAGGRARTIGQANVMVSKVIKRMEKEAEVEVNGEAGGQSLSEQFKSFQAGK